MPKLTPALVGLLLGVAGLLSGCPEQPAPKTCSPDPCPRYTACDEETLTCALLDTVAASDVGGNPAIILGPEGQPQIAAYDQRNQRLVYGVWDQEAGLVRYHAIDSEGDVGRVLAMARFSDGSPAIAYYDASKTRLKFAFMGDDDRWRVEVVDETSSVGTDIGITVDQDDVVHVSYRDLTYRGLRYGRRDSGLWHIEFVDMGVDNPSRIPAEEACPAAQRDTIGRGVGLGSRIAVQGSTPVIVYHDADCGSLRMARWETDGWTLRVLDGWSADDYEGPTRTPTHITGRFSDIAIDPLGRITVVYFDGEAGVLKTLRSPGGTPVIEVIDDGIRTDELGVTEKRIVGQMPSLVFDAAGDEVVSHLDAATRRTLISSRVGGAWRTDSAPQSHEGFGTDITIGDDGTRYIVGHNRTSTAALPISVARLSP